MDKTIRRVTSLEEQELEDFLYWQSVPVCERLLAACELSEQAYAFAAAFRRDHGDDVERPEGSSPSV